MGVTYRAVDRVLHRPVALKVIQLGAANGGGGGGGAASRPWELAAPSWMTFNATGRWSTRSTAR